MTVDRVRYQINTLTGQRLVALFGADHARTQKQATAQVCLRVWEVRRMTGRGVAQWLTRDQAKEADDDR